MQNGVHEREKVLREYLVKYARNPGTSSSPPIACQALYGGVRVGVLGLDQCHESRTWKHEEAYRCSGFWKAEKDDFSWDVPFCLPIPSLFNTSRTSPGPANLLRCWPRDFVGVSLRCGSGCATEEVWSKVEIDGARLERFGFEMLLRPSSASRSSLTPTPRVERARLWRDIFSICMRAGATLMRGDRASRPRVS